MELPLKRSTRYVRSSPLMGFLWDLDMALVIEVFGFMQKKGRYVKVCIGCGTIAMVLPQTLARGFGVDRGHGVFVWP